MPAGRRPDPLVLVLAALAALHGWVAIEAVRDAAGPLATLVVGLVSLLFAAAAVGVRTARSRGRSGREGRGGRAAGWSCLLLAAAVAHHDLVPAAEGAVRPAAALLPGLEPEALVAAGLLLAAALPRPAGGGRRRFRLAALLDRLRTRLCALAHAASRGLYRLRTAATRPSPRRTVVARGERAVLDLRGPPRSA